MAKIHNSAIIGKDCKIGDNVFIGPYSVIEDNVKKYEEQLALE